MASRRTTPNASRLVEQSRTMSKARSRLRASVLNPANTTFSPASSSRRSRRTPSPTNTSQARAFSRRYLLKARSARRGSFFGWRRPTTPIANAESGMPRVALASDRRPIVSPSARESMVFGRTIGEPTPHDRRSSATASETAANRVWAHPSSRRRNRRVKRPNMPNSCAMAMWEGIPRRRAILLPAR